MLECYLDDSDAEVSKVETIAGYVGERREWEAFEIEANAICGRYSVDLIRGRELDGRKGCYRGWPLPRIEAFLEDIGAALAGRALFGISRSIGKERYKLRKRQLSINPELSGFGFCFGTIIHSFRSEAELGISERFNLEGMNFRVEAGSRNNPDLIRYITSEVMHGNLCRGVAIEEIGKRSCRAVQLADLYAFYSRRHANKYARFASRLSFFPDIHSIHIRNKLRHITGYIEEPYTGATNLRTGQTFHVVGLVKQFEQRRHERNDLAPVPNEGDRQRPR